MNAKKSIPEFNFDELLTSMQQGLDHARGKLTARTHQLSRKPSSMSPAEIAAIRAKLNVSQSVFADLLNIPKATAIAWESGQRSPSGAAVRLLQIARETPDVLVSAVAEK